MVKHVVLLCLGFFLIGMKTVAAEDAPEQVAAPQYEYLKPSPEAKNEVIEQVYYKNEMDGVSLISSMTLEGETLVLNYAFINQGKEEFSFRSSDAKLLHNSRDLKPVAGQKAVPDRSGDLVGLAASPDQELCQISPGGNCVGTVRVAIPEGFLDGSQITVSIPMMGEVVQTGFMFEKGWMTGAAYREKALKE